MDPTQPYTVNDHRTEDQFTKSVEEYTAALPSSAYLAIAIAAMAASLALQVSGREKVGQLRRSVGAHLARDRSLQQARQARRTRPSRPVLIPGIRRRSRGWSFNWSKEENISSAAIAGRDSTSKKKRKNTKRTVRNETVKTVRAARIALAEPSRLATNRLNDVQGEFLFIVSQKVER